jgi:hypothetical protein
LSSRPERSDVEGPAVRLHPSPIQKKNLLVFSLDMY